MELLAPAGNMESFRAGVQAGADAVYVGAPALNARNLARDLRLEEIAAMIHYCREHGLKFYLAANSLVREQDLPQVIETLAILEELRPDALIVQDLGVIKLVRDYFPGLTLHASTLMAAHNSEAVRAFSDMGIARVVLARELTIKEISAICKKSTVEIEVFVHGAMCFSYSGLCLFSSFLGGKSGLRGRCVQPCRRQYNWEGKSENRSAGKIGVKSGKKEPRESFGSKGASKGGKGAYLFSMDDLSGLEAVPLLAEAGVASLKIEGRLRTAHYVSHVVQAYRMVMDEVERARVVPGGDEGRIEDVEGRRYSAVLQKAGQLVEKAMSRKVGPGYFLSPQPLTAITPYHSGNAGLHLGRFNEVRQGKNGVQGSLTLKDELEVGDRLRLHLEATGERHSFTLQEMIKGKEPVEQGKAGETVWIGLPVEGVRAGAKMIDLYKVDVRSRPQLTDEAFGLPESRRMKELVAGIQDARRGKITTVRREVCASEGKAESQQPLAQKGAGAGKSRVTQRKTTGPPKVQLPLEWWLKTDSLKLLQDRLPFTPDRFLISVDKAAVSQVGQIKRSLGVGTRNITWCLPPILFETELALVQKQITLLIRSGFKSFQIGHISQAWMFQGARVHLSCDYTISLMNNQALAAVAHLGAEAAQLSIEADRTLIADVLKGSRANKQHIRKGLTVYGAPALFTARLAAKHFQYDRVLTSPKGESFTMHKKDGLVKTVPCRPFSLLPYLGELRDMGLDYVVVDLCHLSTSSNDMQALADRLSGAGRMYKLPTFNYLGTLE
ncbi:MAG: U32 family peptidase [Desulfobulbaceae bacterium]|nr:U32 family peptidase [Desulfobulbaceae bacterium]